jgi:hypothetical protein
MCDIVLLAFRLHQVKALQDGERMREYLALLRTMEGYASLVFPHCASDAKREGHVVPILSFQAFRLQVSYYFSPFHCCGFMKFCTFFCLLLFEGTVFNHKRSYRIHKTVGINVFLTIFA